MTTLIGDLVELAREEPGARRTVEPVELAAVVEPGGRAGPPPRARPEFDVHTEPWWVTGDADALERAITNLLDNAAKWSPPAGTVTVALTERHARWSPTRARASAEADLPHVFDRFYRSAESRAMPGSGLGLSIVARGRRAARRHRPGRHRRPGAAPAFWFAGPRQTAPAEPARVLARS